MFNNPVLAWDNLTGGDHGGDDWIITSDTELAGDHTNVGNFVINSGTQIYIRAYDGTNYGKLNVSAKNISVGGTVNGDYRGYPSQTVQQAKGNGPGGGFPGDYNSGGGGYGGDGCLSASMNEGGRVYGLVQGGKSYGSVLDPYEMGSSGGSSFYSPGSGAGGAAIKFSASQKITINGSISVNGQAQVNDRSGGGAGGSIGLFGDTIEGDGKISANGGSAPGYGAGGGSGGRIALHYRSANTFSGTVSAINGSGGSPCEYGTVVYVDDTNNDLYITKNQTWHADPLLEGDLNNFRDIYVQNSIWYLKGYYTDNNDSHGLLFEVRNFNLGSSSSINMDGFGYAGSKTPCSKGPGPGGGYNGSMASGGAGHGGRGGNSEGAGGEINDSADDPIFLGSAGGSSCSSPGSGNGGGSIKIVASDTITINGSISANGSGPSGDRSAGGSGGSINLTADKIVGSGNLTANGGSGSKYAPTGTGSGGRISFKYHNSKTYTGTVSVSGGSGAESGTVFTIKATLTPSSLDQYRQNKTTMISTGGNTSDHTLFFGIGLSGYSVGTTLWPQVEIQKNSDAFTNSPNLQGNYTVFSGDTTTFVDYSNNVFWHLSGWSKRQRITVSNVSAQALYNYPLKINVSKTSDIKSDYSDLMFYDQYNNQLDYYIESKDSNSATVWVKSTFIPSMSVYMVYMYYGNQSASYTPSAANVFDFFDDFNGDSIDQSKWAIDNSTGFSVGNGYLAATNTLGRIKTISTYSSNKAAEFKVNTSAYPSNGITMGYFFSSSNSLGLLVHNTTSYYRNDSSWVSIGTSIPVSNNLIYSFKSLNSTQVNYSIFNSDTNLWVIPPATVTNQVLNESVALGKRFDDSFTGETYNSQWDWVRVRNIVSIEPTISIGSEESKISLNLDDLTGYHWQSRVCDQSGYCSYWVPFDNSDQADFNTLFDILSPTTNASNVHFDNSHTSGNWTNQLPKIIWNAAADNPGGSGISAYCLSLVKIDVGSSGPIIDPCADDGILPGDAPYLVGTTSVDLNSIADLNLISGKEYFFSIKSVDAVGNIFLGASDASDYANLLSFKYDGISPANVTSISAVSGSYSSLSDIYFTWPTSGQLAAQDADSGILGYQYSIGSTGNWHGNTTAPTFDFSYLSVNTSQPYFLPTSDTVYTSVGANSIYFRTVDQSGNFSPASTYRTALFSFGGDAPAFPNNSSVSVTLLDNTSTSRPANLFDISWPKAEAFQGNSIYKYFYMINTQPPQNYTTIKSNSSLYIPIDGTSLSSISLANIHRGSNTIYVVAVDDNLDAQNALSPNYSPSNSISATFDFNSDLPDPPRNLVVSDSSIKAASLWRASLAWDMPAYAGTGQLSFTIQRSPDGLAWTTVGTSTGLAYLDTVSTSKKYYWRVGSSDNSDDSTNSPSYTSGVTLIPRGTYTSPPDLSSQPTLSSITTKKAKISWSTSRTSDSKIALGTESKKYFDEEPSNSTQVTDHVINLTNLTPGTTYYYVAKWTDEDGNTGQSEEKTFSTNAAPTVKDVSLSNIGLDSALLKFTSTGASKSKIYYGKSTAFGSVKELSTASEESSYTVQLSELEDGTKYYYKINLTDSEGDEYEGTILSFDTLPRPKISQVTVQQVPKTAQSTLLITWKTNTEISSIITYQPQSQPEQSRDEVDIKLLKGEHKMLLKGLLPDTVYTLIVRGRDLMGNEAVSERITFTTASDTRPPLISDLNIEGSNVPQVTTTGQESTTQLIVSWNTDEPATSQVELGEGSGTSYQQRSQEDNNLTYNHLVIISNLPSSKVYHLRSLSKDKAGNLANSVDTVTITPKATDNALDLVITNLSEAFGFIKKFNQ